MANEYDFLFNVKTRACINGISEKEDKEIRSIPTIIDTMANELYEINNKSNFIETNYSNYSLFSSHIEDFITDNVLTKDIIVKYKYTGDTFFFKSGTTINQSVVFGITRFVERTILGTPCLDYVYELYHLADMISEQTPKYVERGLRIENPDTTPIYSPISDNNVNVVRSAFEIYKKG